MARSPENPQRIAAIASSVRSSVRDRRVRLQRRVLSRSVDWMERQIDRRSPLRPGPFFEPASLAWTVRLEEQWKVIRGELDGMLEYRADLPNFQDISVEQKMLTDDDGWKTLFFFGYGYRFDGNCERCPETARLLDNIPGLTTAFFSVLAPQKHVPEHRGPYKGVLRYHLGLKIPSPREETGIKVGGEVAHWTEGKGLLFDDTYLHEAWNYTGEDRVVLFLDIVRPMPFPLGRLNEWIIRGIGKSPLVRGAIDNHDAWERRFEELRGGHRSG